MNKFNVQSVATDINELLDQSLLTQTRIEAIIQRVRKFVADSIQETYAALHVDLEVVTATLEGDPEKVAVFRQQLYTTIEKHVGNIHNKQF